MISYESIEELVRLADESGRRISEICLEDQAKETGLPAEEVFARMEKSFDVMLESAAWGQEPGRRSTSGLTGGEGSAMMRYADKGNSLMGTFMSRAVATALAVSDCNAAMGRIVATPTAGSCGILPGCLIPMYKEKGCSRRDVVLSVFTAGAFGIPTTSASTFSTTSA